ncbi:serine hydrolase domain-containing protein [Aestuariimicrobium ganziense]|uniref:serine hydrolase domain-containing protein n=1 Tax=Aestuariimicrobium ganziense TaxID=2773677 RepID=UPI001944D5DB|nr:serine hydrolase domain-containing protein [Aestuariimicrobium ganziense]
MTSTTTPGLSVADAVAALRPFLDDWFETQRTKTQVPGVQVAIRDRGDLLYSKAFGLADQASGERLTTRHGFRIASHSKTFTATAVMQQVEEGLLRLDDPLRAWLPELDDTPAGSVTIRELLSHQAGIARDGEDANFWQLDHRFHDRDSLLAELRKDLVLAPQQHFHYSNLGYSALGLVLEAVTGKPWAEVMTTMLDELPGDGAPLRLGPEIGVGPKGPMASGHSLPMSMDDAPPTPVVIAPVNTFAEGAATGFWGTAEGTTTWLAAHALGTDQLLSDASKRLMQRKESTVVEAGQTRWYGLGLIQRKAGDRTLVGHSGGFPGHITQTWVDPVEGLAVAVLTNRLGTMASDWATAVYTLVDKVVGASREEGEPIDPERFAGRFQALWGTTHLVPAGARVVRLGCELADPAQTAVALRVTDDLRLHSPAKDGFADYGEDTVLTRGPSGAITSVTTTGITSWPPAQFRRRLPALLSGERLG